MAGTYYNTVYLQNFATQNPFTVGSSGLISVVNGDGIVGTAGYAWTLFNQGTIASSDADGVNLTNGGLVVNGQSGSSAGLISSVGYGVRIQQASGTVINHGTVSSRNGGAIGIYLGGMVTNSGSIVGDVRLGGLFNYGSVNATVINSGSITGDVILRSSSGTLTNTGAITGAVFSHAVNNLGTIAAGSFGVGVYLNVNDGGVFPSSGLSLTNSGNISGGTGVRDITSGTIANYGTITAIYTGVILAGTTTLVNGGTITGGLSAGGTAVSFLHGTELLAIKPGAVFNGALSGFTVTDTIDLVGVKADSAVFSGTTAGGTLSVMNGTAVVESLVLAGRFANNFAVAPDGHGGVNVTIRQPIGNVIGGTYTNTVVLSNPGITTVTSTGRITPPSGDGVVNAAGSAGSLINMGRVTAAGSGGHGIYLGSGGFVTNSVAGAAGGYISGAGVGVMIGGGVGTVTNSGTVAGGVGVAAAAGVTLTVTNAGTVTGTAGTAVSLGGGKNRLIVDPGAVFKGSVDGGGGSSVLEIAPAGGAGSSASSGALGASSVAYVSVGGVQNFSALQVDSAATLDGSGVFSFDTLTNQGQINVASGDSLAFGTVASAANTGTIALFGGGTITFSGAVAANQTLDFKTVGGTAAIDQPAEFLGTITEFTAGDTIYLPLAKATFLQYTAGVLSLSYLGATVDLTVATPYASPEFLLTADNASGTDITVQASPPPPQNPCYCRGTLIRTETGEVPVERLAIGDRVVTLSGACKPVVWIGFGRSLVTRRNSDARPVIVRRGALGDNVPARDLYLSHGHALYLGGALIPAEHLINHRSILWDDAARVVEYYHVELADHDVLFAEGAPAETYHDAGNRAFFHNARPGSEADAVKPTFAPVLHDGDRVGEVWAGLFARAGGRIERDTTDDPDLHLVLDGERIDPAAIAGGVYNFAVPRPPAATLRLVSRSGVPSLVGLGRHDHRPLGIAIKEIILDHAGIATSFDYAAPQLREGGCHAAEDGYSWTAGDLELPLRFFSLLNGSFTLAVHTKPHYDMRYPISPPVARAA